MNEENAVKKIIYGVAMGDAAGCPVQFFKRGDVKKLNITDMVGHGTYNKPAGTWTDDTSMTLALADSLADSMALGKDVDYTDIMKRFESWLFNNEYTTEKRAFDMGQTCSLWPSLTLGKEFLPLNVAEKKSTKTETAPLCESVRSYFTFKKSSG